MTEFNLIAYIEQTEWVAFKLVKSIIFFYGLWHLLDGHLHIGDFLKKRSNALKTNILLLGKFVNYVEAEARKTQEIK
jgi:hypothetical protein